MQKTKEGIWWNTYTFLSCSSSLNPILKGVNLSRSSPKIYQCSVNPTILKAIPLKFPLSLLDPLSTYQSDTILAMEIGNQRYSSILV